MKTCYVSAPFGTKTDPTTGRLVDFDRIYREVIAPAVSETGVECIRGDELGGGPFIPKSILSHILGSEVMVADITTASPNVLYELGVRHAARRDVTIVIMAEGARPPFHMSYNRLYFYELDGEGAVSGAGAEKLRETLISIIRLRLEQVTNDSPIFEFFPGTHVELSEELSGGRGRKSYPRADRKSAPRRKGLTTQQSSEEDARLTEQAVRDTPNVDPYAHIEVLKKYRDASAWGELVRYADELPPEVSGAPEVSQLLALALNRRGESGDQERAIKLMKNCVSDTGGDAESYGILGRIYKDLYEKHKQSGDEARAASFLEEAIEHYRKGFEKQPSEYYPGVNVVTLLLQRRDGDAKRQLAEILPRVRQSLAARMQGSGVGYWELATALELACVAREWDEAEGLSRRALEAGPARWMMETTARNIMLLRETAEDESDRERLAAIARRLGEAPEPSGEGSYA